VLRTVQAFAAGDTIIEAAGRVDVGDRGAASRLLAERASSCSAPPATSPSRASRKTGSAWRGWRARWSGVSDPLALAVLLRGSGTGYLQ
jgi:hypothetical protein